MRTVREYTDRHPRITMLALLAIAAGLMYLMVRDGDRVERERCARYQAANHREPSELDRICTRVEKH